MDFKKTLAATVVATTLGVGGLALTTAGGATANPLPTTTTAVTAAPTSTPAKGNRHPEMRRRLRRMGLKEAAHAIDITPKALVAELRTGKSIAQVATAHGVAVSTVETDLVNAGDKLVDKAVANHKLTPERAAKIKARIPARVDKIVNHVYKAK